VSPGRPRRAVAGLVAALALAAAVAPAPGAEPLPEAEAFRVPGLGAAVEILIDRYGVPHIYARSEDDLFFAQGFNIARDRLFQLDIWRRRGRGELAAVFGASYVEADRAARLFLYRGDMHAEWAAYGADSEAIAARFVAGINAYIDFLDAHPERLPPEFRLLDYRPARWSAEDVVRIRSHGLSRNLSSEVARAHVACVAGLAADRVRAQLAPAWRTRLPRGLDPCLPDDVLRVFRLATGEFHLTQESRFTPVAAAAAPAADAWREGSNNWAIAPAKSATGRAVLANDPHRDYVQPSIRYLVDLESPTLRAIGANETHLPGISLGHNDAIAFGYTIFRVDQEDLYVYELGRGTPLRYRYRHGWEPLRAVHESIEVRGAAPVAAELLFTRHGPVIDLDLARHRAYAVRTAWLEPGTEPYLGALLHLRAGTLAEFESSIARWGAPSLNHLYADVHGTIAWLPAGFAPRRPNWDGLLPVPGDGRYEWHGHWPHADLPRRVNPPAGYLTTSNEMNLPAGYPNRIRKLGFEWESPFRHQRIDAVLKGLGKVTLEDSLRLQNDETSIPALRLMQALQGLRSADAAVTAARAVLAGWNGEVRGDSAAAALYEVWYARHLAAAVKDLVLPPRAAAAIAAADPEVLLDVVEHPARWLPRPADARRDSMLAASLHAAYVDATQLLGADASRWRWDALHYNLSEHPFAAALDPVDRAAWSIGPLPKGGDAFVPNLADFRPSDFRQLSGPSIRVVIDVGRWDNSWAMNFPGQSGDPRDPHYRDLARPWLGGEYFPLLYSREAVERATERTVRLLPP
jgi:penicillin amidase